MAILPQEIQVWYVLPALRRELAVTLIKKHRLSQKKVASLLGISEGAVSQYLSLKRGTSVKFELEVMSMIEQAAAKIKEDDSSAMHELMKLSEHEGVKRIVCELHIEQDTKISKNCDICFRS